MAGSSGDRMVDFVHEVEDIALDIDDLPPGIPSGRGRSAWIVERAQQAIKLVQEDRGHVVEAAIVQAAPEDLPDDLQSQWPWPDIPVRSTSEDNGLLTPIPTGTFRLWLTVAQDPRQRLPAEVATGMRLADLALMHGIVPSEDQEDAVRGVEDMAALWEAIDPASLAEALAATAG